MRNKKCEGCAWNTGRYRSGCEPFRKLHPTCENYSTPEQVEEVEKQIRRYKTVHDEEKEYRRLNA
jgi:hypothetical protein